MDMFITVTSGKQDPCDFTSNFIDSIDIHDGYEVALAGIYHGPVYNIVERNSRVTLIKGASEIKEYYIPPGFYESSTQVMYAIYHTLAQNLGRVVSIMPEIKYKPDDGICSIKLKDHNVNFLVKPDRDHDASLLNQFGYYNFAKIKSIECHHFIMGASVQPTFIYSNIVSNSIVDDRESRLLTCVPLQTDVGYSYYEFNNPSYHPLRVNSFTDISFQMRDVHGELVRIKHMEKYHWEKDNVVVYPTIMILHVRKRSIG